MEVPALEEKDVSEVKDELNKEDEEVTEESIAETEIPEKDEEKTAEDSEQDDAEKADEMEKLKEELNTLQQEKEDLYQRFLRTQAEFDNYKKRSLREREAQAKYKSQDLVTELLPVIDNFERALQVEANDANKGLLDGISMVYKQLMDALKTEGVEPIEAVGKEFDPNIHQAVMQVEDETKDSNIIVEELQKGYMLKDRVIRPSMVKVNK